jgi:hypothetical protein
MDEGSIICWTRNVVQYLIMSQLMYIEKENIRLQKLEFYRTLKKGSISLIILALLISMLNYR